MPLPSFHPLSAPVNNLTFVVHLRFGGPYSMRGQPDQALFVSCVAVLTPGGRGQWEGHKEGEEKQQGCQFEERSIPAQGR